MTAELQKVRQSIAELEHKLADGDLSDNVRALAERALRLVRMNEEALLMRALNAYERPEVLQ
jgi:uncharacterized protein (UPF0147 family)